MKKSVMMLALLSLSAHAAQHFQFIDKDLDSFAKRMIPASQKEKFVAYFNSYSAKLAACEPDMQKQQKADVAKKAQHELEADYQVWAQQISDFLTNVAYLDSSYNDDRADIQAFLERYGVYKEFVHANNPKSMQVAQQTRARKAWNNVKSGVSKATQKMGSWIKNVKSQVMA